MLELRNLNVSFQNKTVFDSADYCACAGKMNLIIGPSGTGKSTLMKALFCEYPAEYTIDGEALHLCGLNEPEIRRSFALRMCVQTVMMSAISILLFMAAVTILAKKNIVLIRPSYPAFLGIAAVSSLIFLAVPYLLYLYTCRNNN